MNHRIHEIADDCWKDTFHFGPDGPETYTEFDYEKFAELLLKDRQWTNLTDAEIGEIYRAGWSNNQEFARAIESKLKEKNQ